ncbi:hypothetical protein [Bradyrhizobium sp. 141]|uniref:hypothetical protein n=1 Tax=Bradyrhizobium sp. 141 TaxID=2782617 RepID=UPI001FF9B4D8|nr:hypothetical protein [Bradyrhizobium sp. 141]MCK1718875.1 hypothetical protein [Bradyrhizobium sp. 141]
MRPHRPTPQQIAAKRWEIKRRYERKTKVGKRTKSMAAIRLAELTRWLEDTHGAGVELEPGPDTIRIAEVFAHHLAGLANPERRISQWLAFYVPSIPPREQERLIANAMGKPIHWSADKLAWRIRLTDEQRTRLKITTIGAIDLTREQRAARRKARQAELQRALRARRKAASVNTI